MNFFANNKATLSLALALALLVGITACVKTEFDEPPAGGEPITLTPTKTIADLKALHISKGGFDKVTEDIIIGGQVVMNDSSGNYYKTLVIQDNTGGLEVKFNDGFLYQQFALGRTVYIRCKDLLLTDYNGMPQITGSIVTENGQQSGVGLTEAQVRSKVVKGAYSSNRGTPKKVKINELNEALLGTLIELEDVQFVPCDAGKSYADAATQNSLNRVLEDCSGNELFLRSSGFANFAAQNTATGKGKIVGVLSIYNTNATVDDTDFQLYIRDQSDVNMAGTRCGSGSGPGGTLTDISAIRSIFTGTTTTLPTSRKIKGVVISDRNNRNLNSRNLFLQDGTAGIVVRFLADHCYDLGDEIEVEVSGLELSEFNKLLQVNNVPNANATTLGSGRTVTPRTATVAQINANSEAWESTLVKISNCTITGGATLSGNRSVSDGTATIPMFTQSFASFSSVPVPTNAVTITAIVSDFNGKQIILRNAADLQ